MKNSIRASSATAQKQATPLNMQKREKLKVLMVEKIMKKLNLNISLKREVEKEVSILIQKEKLNENDLKQLEEKLKSTYLNYPNQLYDLQSETKSKKSHIDDDEKSVMNNSALNKTSGSAFNLNLTEAYGIKYDDITNFELRKLLHNEKTPIIKKSLEKDGDEWTAIAKFKNKQWSEIQKENRIQDKQKKQKTREVFDSQIREKQQLKNNHARTEINFHNTLIKNVEKLTDVERRKREEIEERKRSEKDIRNKQIQENLERKLDEFSKVRNFDNKMINNILSNNELEKEREHNRKAQAKDELKRMLRENEEFKQKQLQKSLKEREEDIKAMEEYTRILEKQEQDRVEYFKRCESRQLEAMNRMAENVVKKQNEKAKEEELKCLKYQMEKDRKDQEEEDRRKLAIKNSKVNMRHYLTNQMQDKKENEKYEKMLEQEQLDMWSQENKTHFDREKEINQKMKQSTKQYGQLLRSQMNPNKKGNHQQMNEEEYRLNKDIIDEITSFSPNQSKRNYLI